MNRPINLMKLFLSISIIISIGSSVIFAEQKTDFKSSAKIIGVADPDFKEYSYIDMGTANGVKAGDRFMVQGKYGKVMVEVVQSFQRMASVRIVDSWLLGEGNNSERVASSIYPKIRVAKYVERKKIKKSSTASSARKPAKKPKTAENIEKPVEEPVTTEPAIPGLPGESVPDAAVPEGDSGVPVGEPDTALPGEETLPAEPGVDAGGDMGMPADGAPADMGAEPGMDAGGDMGMPADGAPADMGAEPGMDAGGDM
jgi:hypothetical protein